MTEQTHRAGVAPRSGDTHVIDPTRDHAEPVNVDAAAREAAAEAPAIAAPGPEEPAAAEEQAEAEVAAPRGRGR